MAHDEAESGQTDFALANVLIMVQGDKRFALSGFRAFLLRKTSCRLRPPEQWLTKLGRMTNCLAFIVVLPVLFAASFSAKAEGDSIAKDAEQVSRLQSQLVDAYIHHDISTLQRILADDYVFTNDRGEVETKERVLANFKTGGDRTISSYAIHDPKVKVYGDAAIMTYSYTSKEQYKGREEGGTFRITRVFIRTATGWQMVAGHETRLLQSANNRSPE